MLVCDFDRIAKTVRGKQSRLCALAFDQGVSCQGGAVNDQVHVLGRDISTFQDGPYTLKKRNLRRIRRGQQLETVLTAQMFQDDVRKSTTNIDGQSGCLFHLFSAFNRKHSVKPWRNVYLSLCQLEFDAPISTICDFAGPGIDSLEFAKARSCQSIGRHPLFHEEFHHSDCPCR